MSSTKGNHNCTPKTDTSTIDTDDQLSITDNLLNLSKVTKNVDQQSEGRNTRSKAADFFN